MFWMTIIFFLSGLSALVYQLLWMRQLGFIFGNTVYAGATVLVAFMGGLALGAQVLGRFADRLRRPVLWFAGLEFAVAALALAMPFLFAGLRLVYAWTYQNVSDSLLVLTPLRFVLALLILLAPTFCMGGTLPVLVAGLARDDERFGRRMGWLYGINTLGALAGVLICGFFLIPAVGLTRTNQIAVLSDFIAGLGALVWVLVYARAALSPAAAGTPEAPVRWRRLSLEGRWGLLATAVCGFVALALEVVWFRALILVFGSTTYSFTTMLSVFLGGIAVGSLLMAPWLDRRRQVPLILALCVAGMGGWSLWSMYSYDGGPEFLLNLLARDGFTWATMNQARFRIAIAHLLIPALCSGAAFAAAARLLRCEHAGSAHATGLVYAVNTWAAVAGSFIGGFVLLPRLGIEKSLFVLGLLCLLTGLLGAFRFCPGKPLKALVAVAGLLCAGLLLLAPPQWSPELLSAGAYFSPFNFVRDGKVTLRESILSHRLLLYREGLTSTVSVQLSDDEKKVFSMDGKVEADESTRGMVVQRMIGHLPMLFHPNPQRVINIGLGAGVSFGALSAHDPQVLEVAEIEPKVQEATRVWGALNHHVLEHPRARVIINDGRNYLLCTTNRYDVISADPFEPVVGGASHLFTVDYFRHARSRLAEGGLMCQWVPMYEMSKDDYLMIVRSFMQVFPESALFYTGFDTLLLGFRDEMRLDPEVLRARYSKPAVRQSLAEVGFDSPEMILGMFVADLRQQKAFAGVGALNTDDKPHIEFNVPRSAMRYTTDANQQGLLECFTELPEEWLAALTPAMAERLRREHEAVRLILEAGVLRTQNQVEEAFKKLADAHEISPNNPVVINEMVSMLVNSAATLRGQGLLADAAEQFQTALQLQPDEFWALYNLVELGMQAGEVAAAEAWMARALERYPDSPLMKGLKSKFLLSQGTVQEALSLAQTAAEEHPGNMGLWKSLYQMATAANDYARANEARRRAKLISDYLGGVRRFPAGEEAMSEKGVAGSD